MKSLTQFIKESRSADGMKVRFEDFIIWLTDCAPDYDNLYYMEDTVWGDFEFDLMNILDAGKKAKKFNNFKQFVKWCEKHKDDKITLNEQPNAEDSKFYDYSFNVDGIDFDFVMCGNTYPNRLY